MATLPPTIGSYKSLLKILDLLCECRYVPGVDVGPDGLHRCLSCGRYVPHDDR